MKDALLDKREEACALLECYKGLLSKSQQEIFSSYYNYDLSLSEIAEERGVSRAAVSDALAKGFRKLEALENEVGLLKKKADLEALSLQLRQAKNPEESEKALVALEEYVHHGL